MSYIKLNRNNFLKNKMVKERPTAFVLLSIIADRAKRSLEHPDKSLEIGEALIGDYENYGVKEQVYKTDKEYLKTNEQITTRVTNRGTIAKLISTEIFDINEDEVTTKIVKKQRPTNEQLTTNNNDNNVKKKEIEDIYTSYKELINKDSKLTEKAVLKIKTRLKSFSLEDLFSSLKNFSADEWWMENNSNRGIAWFFDSDDRIDMFKTLKPKSKKTVNVGFNINSLNKQNDSNT